MTEKMTSDLLFAQRMILWAIGEKPMTRKQIQEAVGITESCVISNIRKLNAKGLIHVVGDVPTTGRRAPIYAAKTRHPKPDSKVAGRKSRTSPTREAVVRCLRAGGPLRSIEICQETGLSYAQVRAFIHATRSKDGSKLIRIASWQFVDGYGHVAQYSVGPGPDAPEVKRTKKQREAEWRERNREHIRIQRRAWKAKQGERVVDLGPFADLIRISGAAVSAAKREVNSAKESA